MRDSPRADVLTAYDGVERLDRFDTARLAEYRALLLERTAAQSAFIERLLVPDAQVVEVGSGNGRLLIDLALRGVLGRGLGIDVAQSRTAFATAWARAAGVRGVEFVCDDALSRSYPAADAAVCITGAFSYFDAITPGGGGALLRKLAAALAPSGVLVLEVYPHAAWRRMLEAAGDGVLRLWHELPPEDPWRYYLSELALDADTQVLTHRKTFVHRSRHEIDDSRREHLRLYDATSLTDELRDAGLGDIELYGDWTGRRDAESDELLIAVARAA